MSECCSNCAVDYYRKMEGLRAVCDRDRTKPCMNRRDVNGT